MTSVMSNTNAAIRLRRLLAVDETQIAELAAVLVDCVEGGASVSFMRPLTNERAKGFWRMVAKDVDAGERALLITEDRSVFAEPFNWSLINLRTNRIALMSRRCSYTDGFAARDMEPH